jgi:hypothetical protein
VEDVDDLEVDAVDQNQISPDENVDVVGRRRRQKGFDLMRTGLHSAPEFHRQRAANNQLPFESRGKMVTLRESGGQVRVVRPIPLVQIAVALGVVMIPVVVAIMLVLLMAVSVAVTMVAVVIIVPVMFVIVIAMVVVLRNRDGGREGKTKQCSCAGPEPEFRRHKSSRQSKKLAYTNGGEVQQITVVQYGGEGSFVEFLPDSTHAEGRVAAV